ncbi:uncharacterized protein LOC120352329 [Nilaparvata lugens]|uniref:uncharacterized protein LOC120352329 n=1 Tax=Nilaparvata lugens TaxID=108931 RepID=UPI00193CDE5F|nr:uncharacterized protein LOC120352329 [Nilaparvata lugens]
MDSSATFVYHTSTHINMHPTSKSSTPEYILPDTPLTPPQPSFSIYWTVRAGAPAAASAGPSAAPLEEHSPLRRQGVFVQRDRSEEIIVPDTPPPQTRPIDWAPHRVPLHNITNQQWLLKRKLFEEVVSCEEEEDSITQYKKQRAYEGENSTLTPILQQAAQEEEGLHFSRLINKPTAKSWVPLRKLEEHLPHSILSATEETNRHGRRIILKIWKASTKTECEIYLPQRFALIIPSAKIEKLNENCTEMCLVVKHMTPRRSDIKIIKAQSFNNLNVISSRCYMFYM